MSLRRATFATTALSVVLAVPAASAAPADAASPRQDHVEKSVLKKVNAVRARHGLRKLRKSRALAASADDKSLEMARTRVVSHTSADGTPMDQRVRRYVHARIVGETIAFVPTRSRQARMVVSSWLHSPSHRAAILSPAFRRAGLGRRRGAIAGGRAAIVTLNLASAH
jgi:uncharacterized protein YkwD